MTITQLDNGTLVSSSSVVAREWAGLATIKEYIQQRINTFLPFIQSLSIYQECWLSQATQVVSNHPIWWASHPALAPMMEEATKMDLTTDMAPTKPLWWDVAYHAAPGDDPDVMPDTATTQDSIIEIFLTPCCQLPCQETIIVQTFPHNLGLFPSSNDPFPSTLCILVNS